MPDTVSSYNSDPHSPLALIAGEGKLPLIVLQQAVAQGYTVHVYLLNTPWWQQHERRLAFLAHTPHVQFMSVSQPRKAFEHITQQGCRSLVFAGKVNKWQLFTRTDWDTYALSALKEMTQKHDDGVMQAIIQRLNADWNLQVLPQTQFMESLFVAAGVLACPNAATPDEAIWCDAAYGFHLASEMGRLDIGQSVVVHQGMPLAIEAIEGTDACIRRAGRWAKRKGGMLVKVAKPLQDSRFDVPTVGLRTLKRMRQAGLNWLVIEANRTIVTDLEAMQTYATQHHMGMLSVNATLLSPYQQHIFTGQHIDSSIDTRHQLV